ncbi:MAG: hypothetical protein ABIT20_04100 [Gemmatimonadaceae bacterium]
MTAPRAAAPKVPSFLRPALALLAGLGIFVAVVFVGTIATFVIMGVADARHPSTGVLLAQLIVNAVAALLAGFATGRMTWGRSLYTLVLLAIIPSMSSLIPVLKGTAEVVEPQWYSFTRPAVILLGILIGGMLERRRVSMSSSAS